MSTMNWRESVILVTGGTGSFGKKCTQILLREYQPKKLIIFSRDELKQYEMRNAGFDHASMRYFLGDIRDRDRLRRALHGVDVIIHAAALKQVPACEYNPSKAIKTNVDGAQNIVDAAIDCGVRKVLALSTDKAVNPVNLYGATKLCAEKVFVQGNAYAGGTATRFSCTRYGNVLGSRGSVIPLFMQQRPSGRVTVTDNRMTRFWLTLDQGVRFVLNCIEQMQGGEVFVPKIPSMPHQRSGRRHRPGVQDRVGGHSRRGETARGDDLAGRGPPGAGTPRQVRDSAGVSLVGGRQLERRQAAARGLRVHQRPQHAVDEHPGIVQDRGRALLMNVPLAIDGGSPVRRTLLPYGRQSVDEADVAAVAEVLRSDWLTTGPKVAEFEKALGRAAAGTEHAVVVSSGTAALHAAMYALGIHGGDEVLVPAITFAATANATSTRAARPSSATSSPIRCLIDPRERRRAQSPRAPGRLPRWTMPVSPAITMPAGVRPRHGLALVDDACHAIGGRYRGRPVGSLADLNAFSFHPVKL